ncbi:hypothetical protein [Microbacterium gorillae]|uniref:hypothetical protein n=1 Tax=Microbacterium gorillae TaxID=1231063 RepID=UPI00058EB39B|nr:hypothetical protein [Microbacterium gorillae]
MDESVLRARLAAINANLSSVATAQGTLSGLSAAGRRLVAGASGVGQVAQSLVGGSTTGVDHTIAGQMGTVGAGGARFAGAVDRALGELSLAANRLRAEAAWCRAEIQRIEAERAAAAARRR